MRVKNILVPVDFSPCAINAMKYAARLARKFEAEMIVINVAEGEIADDNRKFKKYKKEKLELFDKLTDMEPEFVNIITEIKVDNAGLKSAITSLVDEHNIDLIVMGTKGVHGLYKELSGTNTYHIVKETKVPLLIIPDKITYNTPRGIGFAVDLKTIEDLDIMNLLLDFLHVFESQLFIFHIREPKSEKTDGGLPKITVLDNYFDAVTHEFNEIENEHISIGIDRFVGDKGIDMLAIIARKHNFFEKLIKRSTTRDIAQHTQFPVLVLPE